MSTDDWNPRFVAYASTHGRTPDAQLALDHIRFPGGKFAGFMNWVSAQWAEWRAETGRTAATPITDAEHAAFDAWLDEIARKHRSASVPGAAPAGFRRPAGASIARAGSGSPALDLAGRTPEIHTTAGQKTPPVCVRPEVHPPRTLAGQALENVNTPVCAIRQDLQPGCPEPNGA